MKLDGQVGGFVQLPLGSVATIINGGAGKDLLALQNFGRQPGAGGTVGGGLAGDLGFDGDFDYARLVENILGGGFSQGEQHDG